MKAVDCVENGKRIGFVLGSMGKGGAERVVSLLANSYASKGWHVDIIVLLSNEVRYELDPKVSLVDLSGATDSRLARVPLWITGLNDYAKTRKPDVLLSFVARINILATLACRRHVKSLYVSERNDPRLDGRSAPVDRLTRYLYHKADGVIFQTKRAASFYPELTNGAIIGNPICVRVAAKECDANKIVTVGSMKPQKNQRMLIEAFSLVKKKYPNAELHIVGDGALRTEIENQIRDLGLTDDIFLPGSIDEVHEYIADAQVFALSSDFEGLSNALLEAMSMGLACVSTNCAGSDEVIDHGQSGLLVPVGDARSMSEALCLMMSDDKLNQRCRKNAVARAGAYEKDSVLSQWHELMG